MGLLVAAGCWLLAAGKKQKHRENRGYRGKQRFILGLIADS
jgi:hypothetical protein